MKHLKFRNLGLGLLSLLAVSQLVPVYRVNPPVTGEPVMTTEVQEILTRACFDCHSNRTIWPWYSRVAPVSWFIANHVNEGREHLNFSTWDTLSARDREKAVEEIAEEVDEGKMPMTSYVVGHPSAQLSELDRQQLLSWAKTLAPAEEARP